MVMTVLVNPRMATTYKTGIDIEANFTESCSVARMQLASSIMVTPSYKMAPIARVKGLECMGLLAGM